jgi:GNAT superfamily N-acetyltransferase
VRCNAGQSEWLSPPRHDNVPAGWNMGPAMGTLDLVAKHEFTPQDVAAVEVHLYDFNRAVTGRGDGEGLGFVLRDKDGAMAGCAAGYSWAGISELRQMWIAEPYRGLGHGRALLDAFVGEAARRGVRRVWVASYDFQAPGFYEKAGFRRMAELPGWPEGHTNVILCKSL